MRKSAVVAYKLFKSKVGEPITPAELETAMNVGPYAGREVWILKKRLGLDITTQKNGREVVSYTLTTLPEKEPALITAHFDKSKAKNKAKAKAKVKPAPKAETPAVTATAPKAAPKAKKVSTKKAKPTVSVGPTENDPVVVATEPTGEVAAFSVDPEFDAEELPEFLQRDTVFAE